MSSDKMHTKCLQTKCIQNDCIQVIAVKMTLDKMTLEKIALDKMTLEKMAWGLFCFRHFSKEIESKTCPVYRTISLSFTADILKDISGAATQSAHAERLLSSLLRM